MLKLYKVDMKYIRNLHNIDDKVLSVLPQAGKDNRAFIGIVIVCGSHKYCIPLSSPKEKHKNMENYEVFEDEHYYICHDGRELRHIRTETKEQDGYTQAYEVYGCADCSGFGHKAKCLYKYNGEKDAEKKYTKNL